jgi:hypothetical protein
MSWSPPARPKRDKTKEHALAEGLLIVAVLCLAIVTAARVLTVEAHSTSTERALSPLSSARPLTP